MISVPQHAVPCEVVCSVEQFDPRMLMKSPSRPEAVPILCKVYEKVDGENLYSLSPREKNTFKRLSKGLEEELLAALKRLKAFLEATSWCAAATGCPCATPWWPSRSPEVPLTSSMTVV